MSPLQIRAALLAALVAAASPAAAQSSAPVSTTAAPTRTSAPTPPQVMKLTPEQVARENWRRAMATDTTTQGCAKATYPSMVWQAIPCGPPPSIVSGKPPPVRSGGLVPLESSGNGLVASVTGKMTYATGTFYTGGLVNEVSSVGDTTANTWSVQLNTNFIPASQTPLCKNGGRRCTGWQQFVYATSPGATNAYIQYWLVNYAALPGTTNCPDTSWTFSAGSGCYKNSPDIMNGTAAVPVVPITDLSKITVTAVVNADNTHDMVFGYGDTGYRLGKQNDLVGIQTGWSQTEFNVFGFQTITLANGANAVDVANINSGLGGAVVSVSIKVTGNPGQLGDISCILGGTTAETNNLTLNVLGVTPQQECNAGYWDGWDQIAFSESNAPTLSRISPTSGTQAGGTSVDVYGAGFIPDTQSNAGVGNRTSILFGSILAVGTCDSATHCKVTTPRSNTLSSVNVTAANATSLALGIASSPLTFTYQPYPEGHLSPESGPISGGTSVKLYGSNLSTEPGGTQVEFLFASGASAGQGIACSSAPSTESYAQVCSFTTPPLSPPGPGPVSVPVSVKSGGLTANVGGFTFGPSKTNPPPKCNCGDLKCCPSGTFNQFQCVSPLLKCPPLQ